MNDSEYALFGVSPPEAARPESLDEAIAIVRDHSDSAIVPWGGGRRQHVGYAPERYGLALDTRSLSGVIEYVPDDMVVTVQAGMTISALQSILGEHGQCLPIDVAEPDQQTVGGVIATRSDSVRRFSRGSVRDLLLGVTVINGRAERISGGGRVVKNVSGYDLPKLYCGSYGTLGLIAEASFKVSPRPETSATAILPLTADHNCEDVLDRLLGSDLAPAYVFLANGAAAEDLLGAPPAEESTVTAIGQTPRRQRSELQVLIVGFEGSEAAVDSQRKSLQVFAGVSVPEGRMSTERAPHALTSIDNGKVSHTPSGKDPTGSSAAALSLVQSMINFTNRPAAATAAFHIMSSQVGAFSRMVEWTAIRAGFDAAVLADAAVGMMWAHFEPRGEMGNWESLSKDLSDKALRCGGSFIIERMPDAWRAMDVPVWSPLLPDIALMGRVKDKLDPQRMWNPGRFVGKL